MDLNLARKWRSRNFDGIIGQSLSLRMLKNSLYLDKFFPVYLMSGQRGCGKTTTARVFAAAVNCEKLTQFQKNPKSSTIPCCICSSCDLFFQNRHPDFIEIDAASYTGVDNVRQIIEAASLLPLCGRKKIYLIDEAHMLSKAAFNAFLKILEEPPHSVFFILATTDPHKIPDTVRSRCFQIFFQPIPHADLVEYLQQMCHQESIQVDQDALSIIAVHTEGSARDAINLLERVRFAYKVVNKQAVLDMLGSVDDEHFIELVQLLINKDMANIVVWLSTYVYQDRSAHILWNGFLETVRAVIWCINGIVKERFIPHQSLLKDIATRCTVKQLMSFMDLFYQHELLFLKTMYQHRLFESLIMQLCDYTSASLNEKKQIEQPKKIEHLPDTQLEKITTTVAPEQSDDKWSQVVMQIEQLNDPVVSSLFKKARFDRIEDGKLRIFYAKDLIFFKDWLVKSQPAWQPLVKSVFGDVEIEPFFTEDSPSYNLQRVESSRVVSSYVQSNQNDVEKKTVTKVTNVKQSSEQYYGQKKKIKKEMHTLVDISNKEQWQKAHLILSVFPGTVFEVQQ